MALSGALAERIGVEISRYSGGYAEVERATPVGGGSINDCYRIDCAAGRFFLKVNVADRFPSLFEAEADGLRRLGANGGASVPQVVAYGEDHDDAFLLLEWIDPGQATAAGWAVLGQGLATLHRASNARFGLERDNYIGTLKQSNTPRDTWTAFLVDCRLEPLARMARDRKRLDMADGFRFERLYGRLDSLFPVEPPALLHGDLWSGNRLFSARGEPVLIDPAVYYGHREMDLAMARLFGGFDALFFEAYNEAFPLLAGWEERVPLAQLYPLLVHALLFGGAYANQVRDVLRRYA